METNNLKYKIAKLIDGGYCGFENPTYEQLLESIYENEYKTIHKAPISVILLGTVTSFVIKDIEHANKLLKATKEVIQEALEISGIELTFTDEDWEKVEILENTSQWGEKYFLSKHNGDRKKYKEKAYMSEFFEV